MEFGIFKGKILSEVDRPPGLPDRIQDTYAVFQTYLHLSLFIF